MTTMNPVPRSAGTYEARRVTARVAMIGIPIAVILAAVIEFFRLRPSTNPSVGIIGGVEPVTRYGLVNDRTAVIVVGLLALLTCGIITLVRRALADVVWSVGGVAVLCAALYGYVFWLPWQGYTRLPLSRTTPEIFVRTLWMTAVLLVGMTLYSRGLSLHGEELTYARGRFCRRVWARTGIVAGVGVLVLLLSCCIAMGQKNAPTISDFLLAIGMTILPVALGYRIFAACEKSAYDRRRAGERRMLGGVEQGLLWSAAGTTAVSGVLNLLAKTVDRTLITEEGVWTSTPAYAWITVIIAVVGPLTSVLTLLAMVRFLAAVCAVRRVRPWAILYGALRCVSAVCGLVQPLALEFIVLSDQANVELYGIISNGMSYAYLAIFIAETALLVMMGVLLLRGAGVSGAVFVLPALHILPTLVTTFGLVLVVRQYEYDVEFVERYTAVVALISAVMTAVFYAMIPLVLRRGAVPSEMGRETRDESVPLRKEDFLTEI